MPIYLRNTKTTSAKSKLLQLKTSISQLSKINNETKNSADAKHVIARKCQTVKDAAIMGAQTIISGVYFYNLSCSIHFK